MEDCCIQVVTAFLLILPNQSCYMYVLTCEFVCCMKLVVLKF